MSHRLPNLAAAVQSLRLLFPVQAVSSAWQSAAVGVEASDYLNAALLVQTTLAKHELIALLRRVEYDLGRTRILGDSTQIPIDIDLLVLDGDVLKTDLWDLAYRAIPMAELLPDLASPVTGESLSAAALAFPRRRGSIPAPTSSASRAAPSPRHGGCRRKGRSLMSSLIELSEARERAATGGHRAYRYYDLLMVAFVTVLICSEFISAGKVARVGTFYFGAGVVFFPLSYLFGDILTEVYGYARSRKVIWAGFGALAFATFMSWVVLALPPTPTWPNQAAWETVFGNSWRIVAASLLAFLAGEWVNSVVLAKMKVWTGGRHLWTRTIGSTVAGEAVDSVIFYPLAFLGIWAERPGRAGDAQPTTS